ncbi:cation diffusion facilitator family transporter [Siphonobacter sp. SORGH_AS_1065]|uniref:cation diffusion facilitator family transporter n=1 Tax=Siphonobacter sp. SORGH_AS_1065 TaxID=3041795 RepID=UPI002788A600|nr:cation diffusion facilitator family transporter [Siphonobacter sp. SORGH_AS_1065]MDQ1090230.1 cation diffusion facilitator family transporter [Siphonobacter sp. SORGH_AS_1065]
MNPRRKKLKARKLIKLSIAIGSLLTVWAVAIGILGDSKSIIFDALFSLVGISMSGVSLFVTNFVRKPDDDNLPFGRSQFEPLYISVQSLIIIFLCLYSFATSIIDILNGGRKVELTIAFPYLITSIIVCIGLGLYFRKKARQLKSDYVLIEANEWQLDALLSFGVLVVLSLSYFLKDTSFSSLIPYLDPIIVLIISLLFMRIPARTFWKNIKELLQFAPDDEVEDKIHEASEKIAQQYRFTDLLVRVAKTGSSYTVEIDFLLPKDQAQKPLIELDRIRQELYDLIKGDYQMWLTISFTTERKWML